MRPTPSYYVVAISYPRRFNKLTNAWIPAAVEAVVNPEETRRDVVSRIASGEYKDITFIHSVRDGLCEDLTEELQSEAEQVALQAAE